MRIGYIGLGALGGQLARRFMSAHQLWVWDINENATSELKKVGAETAPTAAELAKRCEVVLLCLPRTSDVRKTIYGESGLLEGLTPGKLIIDQTSGIPEETKDIADDLAGRGILMIDAAVSASPHIVATGGATLMASGPDAAYDRALPILRAVTETIHRCGSRVGDGQAMKLVNNAMNAGCRLGTLEVVALGRKAGVPLREMADFLSRGEARNQTTEKMLPALVHGKASTNFSLALMLKDVNQAVSLGMDQGVPLPITNIVRGLLQIGANTLGEQAQLEDMVGLIQSMAATEFIDSQASTKSSSSTENASALGPDIADKHLAELITNTIASICRLITYECLTAGLQYGLNLEVMSSVLNRSSGWSAASQRIFSELLSGQRLPAVSVSHAYDSLKESCRMGNHLGAPLMIANEARALFEQMQSRLSDADDVSQMASLYTSISGVNLAELSPTSEGQRLAD